MRTRRLPALLAFLLAFAVAVPASFGQSARPADEASTPTVMENPALVQQYEETITPADLAAYLYVYASDYFKGREATMPGQKLAVTYLAGQYRKLGLEPKGTTETDDPYAPEAYFQPFTVYGQRLAEASLTATQDGETLAQSRYSLDDPGTDAYPVLSSMRAETEAPVVFAGYGIAGDSSATYSDYRALQKKGINPQGKWLLMLRDEPMADTTASLIQDGAPTDRTLPKLRTALQSGAAGALLIGDAGPRGEDVAESAREQAMDVQQSAGALSLTPPSQQQSGGYPPVYVISSDLANQMLESAGRTVEELRQEINEKTAPTVFALEGVTLRSEAQMHTREATTENVLAMIEGTDPQLKDEVVVITSHLDHLGTTTGEGDTVYNGADDDGTGTVAMLEIAEAFQQAKRDGHGPRRSVLFLHVSGEEKGLLGSQYYADEEPVVPLEKTVADLNIDMIGRGDPAHASGQDFVYLIGGSLISEDLGQTLVQVNDATGLGLTLDDRYNSTDDPNRFYARSDHYHFGKHNVPFNFFFTGTHEDYHQVGDEAEKIHYDSFAKVARLIFGSAWQLANQDGRPAVSNPGLFE